MSYAIEMQDENVVYQKGCEQEKIRHLVYASSSSVYRLNTKAPFSTSDNVDHLVSLYAATKKANELKERFHAEGRIRNSHFPNSSFPTS
jgi:nucleoside-diphosphate-sugar epimerase